jgi:hypothetical protein
MATLREKNPKSLFTIVFHRSSIREWIGLGGADVVVASQITFRIRPR